MKQMKYQLPDKYLATCQKPHHFFDFLNSYELNFICNKQSYPKRLYKLNP